MNTALAFSLFLLGSSIIAAFLTHTISIAYTQQQLIYLLIITTILALINFYISPLKKMFFSKTKWIFLFLCGLTIQLLILKTGGFYSNFLSLIYLFAFGLSAFLPINTAILFLNLSLLDILIPTLSDTNMSHYFHRHPEIGALSIASFVMILPIVLLFAKFYQHKQKKREQMKMKEEIIAATQKTKFSTNR